MRYSIKNRRWLCTVMLILLILLSLTGCSHTHEWEAATCDTPRTCTGCGETQGKKQPHRPDENGDCQACHKDCTSVLLDGKRYDIPVTVYGEVKLGMIIQSPNEGALGMPCSYSIYDAAGKLVAEGVWSEKNLSLPLAADKYYCAYTKLIPLDPGTYTVEYRYTTIYSCTLSRADQTAYFSSLGTEISAPYPMKFTVKQGW